MWRSSSPTTQIRRQRSNLPSNPRVLTPSSVAVGGRDEDKERLGKGLLGYAAVTAYADGQRAGEVANAAVAGEEPPYQNQDATAIPVTEETVDTVPPYCEPVK